eukprot:4459286-Pyramimonas_sp.AAC.1
MHAIRPIAGSSPESQAAQHWIAEAMDAAVEDEQLKDAGVDISLLIILVSFNRLLAWNSAPRPREGS